MVGSLPDLIAYAKFQVEIFRGYDFTGIFEWALQQCSATALPVMRKLSPVAYAGGAPPKAVFGA